MVTTALLMGFAGSFHCVGMCSPLAITVSNLNRGALRSRLIYNLGRILTYGILGCMTGFAGWLLPFSRFQHALSITLGATLLFVACTGIGNIRIAFLSKPLIALSAFTKKTFAVLLHTKTFLSTFLLGMLNGLLPCGLTFIALTYCLTLSDPLGGFKYMILFGIGTLPAMLGATVLLKYVVDKFNFSLRRITTIMLFISGCILIARVFFVHGAHAPAEEQHLVDIIICGGKQATPMK